MGIVLLLAAAVGLIWLAYKAAVYAFPVGLGLVAGYFAYNTGAGLGAIVVALVVGIFVYIKSMSVISDPLASVAGKVTLMVVYPISAWFAGSGAMYLIVDSFVPTAQWQKPFVVGAGMLAGYAAHLALRENFQLEVSASGEVDEDVGELKTREFEMGRDSMAGRIQPPNEIWFNCSLNEENSEPTFITVIVGDADLELHFLPTARRDEKIFKLNQISALREVSKKRLHINFLSFSPYKESLDLTFESIEDSSAFREGLTKKIEGSYRRT
jgi:hypothetical protein|tara:strand:- start:4641 stop:5447 length:807 start_codon:yes stop_codon:yes gene_type:complete